MHHEAVPAKRANIGEFIEVRKPNGSVAFRMPAKNREPYKPGAVMHSPSTLHDLIDNYFRQHLTPVQLNEVAPELANPPSATGQEFMLDDNGNIVPTSDGHNPDLDLDPNAPVK